MYKPFNNLISGCPKLNKSKYKLGPRIGRGSFSNVYAVKDLSDNQVYAMKIAKPDSRSEELLRKEAEILQKLQHINIIEFVSLNHTNDQKLYMTTQCGKSNMEYYYNKIPRKSDIPISKTISHFFQIATGLVYLKGCGYVHFDIKPHNVVSDDADWNGNVKLIDFGLSEHIDNVHLVYQPGTPRYISPEILSDKNIGFKTDVWSFGVLIYYIVQKKLPFDSEDRQSLYKKILNDQYERLSENTDPIFVKAIEGMLIKNPETRSTIEEVQQLFAPS